MAHEYNNDYCVYAAEREYLEKLLSDRVNLYLVFVSFYFVAVFGAEESVPWHMRLTAFGVGALASVVMSLAVWRTTFLVEHTLDRFRFRWDQHPYTKAYDAAPPLLDFSANRCVRWLPVLGTAAFILLMLLEWKINCGKECPPLKPDAAQQEASGQSPPLKPAHTDSPRTTGPHY